MVKWADPAWEDVATLGMKKPTFRYEVKPEEPNLLYAKKKNGTVHRIEMGEQAEVLTRVAQELAAIQDKENNTALNAYDRGMQRYLAQLLYLAKTALGNGAKKEWGKLALVLHDFAERDKGGFQHDEAGREEWRNGNTEDGECFAWLAAIY